MRVVDKYCFALGVNLSRRFFAYALNDGMEWVLIIMNCNTRDDGTLSHQNKIRLSGFYFIFQGKISSTKWISPVKDGFHCEATASPLLIRCVFRPKL